MEPRIVAICIVLLDHIWATRSTLSGENKMGAAERLDATNEATSDHLESIDVRLANAFAMGPCLAIVATQ